MDLTDKQWDRLAPSSVTGLERMGVADRRETRVMC